MNLIPRKNAQVPKDLFHDLLDIQRDISDLFDFSLFGRPKGTGFTGDGWAPAVDVRETRDNVIVKADLPGMEKEKISVSIHDGVLTLKGEKKEESETKGENFFRAERAYGAFYRAISLPTVVDEEKAKAVYKNGVLELTLPKTEAKDSSRKIEIE
jgi:HSP20 family protein